MSITIHFCDDEHWFSCYACSTQGKSRRSAERAELDADNHNCDQTNTDRQLQREEDIQDARRAIEEQLERQR